MTTVHVGPCRNEATKCIVGNREAGDYTLSCDEHEEELKSDSYCGTWPFYASEGETCCFIIHASDCATHNGPVMEPGPCSCGALAASERVGD